MRRFQKVISCVLLTSLLTTLFAGAASASSTISSVSITVEVEFEVGDRLPDIETSNSSGGTRVYSSNNKYSVSDAEWVTSESKDMTIGEEPKMKVYLQPESDYYFKGSYQSSNVSIKNGTFVSAKKSGDELVVTLKTKPIKGTFAEPEDAYWKDSGLGNARWEEAEDGGSEYYDVYLYRGSSTIKKLEKTKSTSYNFYPYMTKAGTYSFKVRSVPANDTDEKYGKKSDWVESDEQYVAEEVVSDGSGQTGSDGNTTQVGWIQDGNNWYYRYPDSSYQKDAWLKVNDKWYLFDSNSVMLTGWQSKNNRWFYLRSSGDMMTGWVQLDNKWYFLNPEAGDNEGVMSVGWINYNNKRYYANSSGAMIEGWSQVDGNWYYFYPGEGSMAVNTNISGFYLDGNGVWKR